MTAKRLHKKDDVKGKPKKPIILLNYSKKNVEGAMDNIYTDRDVVYKVKTITRG